MSNSWSSPDIFAKVEATLSREWLSFTGENITDLLEKIEAASGGNVQICFRGGSYVICGTFDDVATIRKNFFFRKDHDYNESEQHFEIDEKHLIDNEKHLIDNEVRVGDLSLERKLDINAENDRKTNFEGSLRSVDAESVDSSHQQKQQINDDDNTKSHVIMSKNGGEAISSLSNVQDIVTEVVDPVVSQRKEVVTEVDADIWDFIQEKRKPDLDALAAEHSILVTSEWDDDDGLYKIHLKATDDVNKNRLEMAAEQFNEFYQDWFDKCEIKTVCGKFSSDDVSLQYIRANFKDVLVKTNPEDGILFIGLCDEVRKAKKRFDRVSSKCIKTGHGRGIYSKEKVKDEEKDKMWSSMNSSVSSNVSDDPRADPAASFCAQNASYATDDNSIQLKP